MVIFTSEKVDCVNKKRQTFRVCLFIFLGAGTASESVASHSDLCVLLHSLDFAFSITYVLGGSRQVSTPSFCKAWLGVDHLGFHRL
jgi:hypothetical protein